MHHRRVQAIIPKLTADAVSVSTSIWTVMCGISAYFSARPDGGLKGVVQRSLDLAAHRGPDGRGVVFGRDDAVLAGPSDEAVGWALGHVRLAILDLSPAGRQPMSFDNGRLWITCNGEVYNYLEIRRELAAPGIEFFTGTDTEVVLAAYRRWGPACVDRFVGMFAFVLVDLERRRVFCARDRLGIKPLYYWPHSGGGAFVSEIKQLAAWPDFRPKVMPQPVVDFLVDGVLDHDPQCCFEGVYPLPAGHYLEFDLGEVPAPGDARPYWTPVREEKALSRPEAAARTGDLFRDAVGLRLRSDVPVGSCLSGGVDSSCIVGLVSREHGRPMHTFSSCFDDPKYDERPYIDEVIRHTGCRSTKVYPTEESLLEALDRLVYHQDEPFGGLSIFAQWSVMEAARRAGIPVMLDGQGGDETLCGYRKFAFFHLRSLLADGRFGDGLGHVLHLALSGDRTLFDLKAGRRYLPGRLKPHRNRMKGLLRPAFAARHRYVLAENTSGGRSLHEHQWADLRRWSLPVLLRYEDRNSMAHGVEARVPFVDHRFVEHCLNLPGDFFFDKGRTKRLLIDGLPGVLPEAVRRRRTKMGFETPQSEWMKGRTGRLLESRISGSERLDAVLDAKAAAAALSAYRQGERRFADTALFRIASLAMWLDAFRVDPE